MVPMNGLGSSSRIQMVSNMSTINVFLNLNLMLEFFIRYVFNFIKIIKNDQEMFLHTFFIEINNNSNNNKLHIYILLNFTLLTENLKLTSEDLTRDIPRLF